MCGIAGAVNWGDLQTLALMTDIQSHRGPDDRGLWETRTRDGNWVGLGSRRLSILDLSPAGHMPMSTPDGSITIVYNGEVYNYPQLRSELEAAGYVFRSNSDTEAVLYLYQHEGPESVRKLNGMFALAIWDDRSQQLFLARDHFGIKPLYYCQQNERLAFASEAKAILQLPGAPRRMNLAALHQYLSFLWVPDPLTMFDGVVKLPAGHYAIYKDGRLQLTQYWDMEFPPDGERYAGTEDDLAMELRERFTQAVHSQMRSDVPLGAFLSAGMDSSSIVAVMQSKSNQPVRTFTTSFPERFRVGSNFDDDSVARRTAERFGCQHTQIEIQPDVASLLPKLIWHMDEPVADPAILVCYLVNREARRDVTVLLSGVGGDEVFAGYRKYVAHYMARRYRSLPASVRQYVVEPAIDALPSFRGTQLRRYVRLAKKMARSGSLPPKDRFIMDGVYMTEDLKEELYNDRMRALLGDFDPRRRHLGHFAKVGHADFLNQMLYLDLKVFMVTLNLTYNDKMSMANSVEVRVPFLDRELTEWVAWNVPPAAKLHGRTTKYLLRKAMGDVLPQEIFRQRKVGFGAPVDHWLPNELREMVGDLLSEEVVRSRGLFQPAAVRRLVQEHQAGRQDWAFQIWQLLTLELWMRNFMDAPAPLAAAG
ncbi:MAG: asparagine synthase (glutamine-hydrolyzing) [Pirellulales bacterium]|nr:asparagine synthase (glutamine-hydrolyzing) [Pirellulales bacterium]